MEIIDIAEEFVGLIQSNLDVGGDLVTLELDLDYWEGIKANFLSKIRDAQNSRNVKGGKYGKS